MVKLNRKGFTLVELLVTIAILALVVGFSTYGIITAVNNSRDEAIAISTQSIKDAARIYSGEATSDSWKDIDGYEDKYFCVTVMELINKGLLKEKDVSSKIDTSTYIAVSRNKVTEVIKKEEILDDDYLDSNVYKICTGGIKNEEEEIRPEILSASSFTDQITVNFNKGKAASVEGYECKYGTSSSNLNEVGDIDENNNTCTLNGLKNASDYYVSIYMKRSEGSPISSNNYLCSTKDFIKPEISFDSNRREAMITYDNTNIRDGSKNFYFTSSEDAIGDSNYDYCNGLSYGSFGCFGSLTNNITKGEWFKTNTNSGNNKETIILSYDYDTNPTIEAKIYDDTGNYAHISETYSFAPATVSYNIKFYRNDADSIIDGSNESTEDFIHLTCTAKKGESCSITSPSIEREGHNIIGWNRNASSTNSEWNINTSKNVNGDAEYYAITIPKKYTVSYDVNGGIGAPSNQEKEHGINLSLSTVKPTRDGYTFIGWNTKKDGTGVDYSPGGIYAVNGDVTLYAEWMISSGIKYVVNHYQMDTSGNYPSTPSYIEEKSGSTGANLTLSNLAKSYSGFKYKEGKVDGNVVTNTNILANGTRNVDLYYTRNKIKIYFNAEGGLISQVTNGYSIKNDNIYKDNVLFINEVYYGGQLSNSGLPNYNNASHLNINKIGHKTVSGAEWKCLSNNCKNNIYSQKISYNASELCDVSKDDCSITLGINWTKNTVLIKFKANGGSLLSNSNGYSISNDYVYKNGSLFTNKINYGEQLGTSGLPNYNNSSYLNLGRTGYDIISGSEWICLEGECKNSKFSQSSSYTSDDFCDTKNGDCEVVLGVNWFRTDINGKRYDQKTNKDHTAVYYITTCPNMSYCYFNSLNGISYPSSINGIFANDITKPNGNSIRDNLSVGLSGGTDMYVSSSSGVNCRYGASTNTGIKYAIGCGSKLHVYKTTMVTSSDKSVWWYYYESGDCYIHGGSLSLNPTSCSSGGSGPSCEHDDFNKNLILGNEGYYCCAYGFLDSQTCRYYEY